MKWYEYTEFIPVPKSLREIGKFCNIPDQQRLRKFVDEHSHLIHVRHKQIQDKHVLGYYVPRWLCDFFFDPNRSQRFYSTSWVIDECQQAIEGFIAPNNVSHFPRFFFMLPHGEISNATRLLEHVRKGSNKNDLLLFLGYLSKFHWLDIYTSSRDHRDLTYEIIHWVCITLVS